MTAADDKKAAEAKAAANKTSEKEEAPKFDANTSQTAKEQEGAANDTESTVPKADVPGEQVNDPDRIHVDNVDEEKSPAVNVEFAAENYDLVFDGRSVRVVGTDDKSVVNWFGSRINLRDLLSGIAQNQK